jgi:NADH-quinone oxidoreductase subunit G
MDYLNSEVAQKADVFLPTTTLYESGGVYTNQEARVQVAAPAYGGGIPIAQVGGGDHPPRIYGAGIPGAEPAAAWQLLASLIDGERQPKANDLKAGIWNWLAKTESAFKEIAAIEKIHDDGLRIYREKDRSARFATQRHQGGSDVDGRLELIAVEWIFGTEELSSYSECLTDLEGSPGIFMCRTDAEKLNLTAGDRVVIELDRGTLEANIRVKDNMAAATLIIPRHKNLDWQKMDTGKTWVRPDQIQKQKD